MLEFIPKIIIGLMDFKDNEWHESICSTIHKTDKVVTIDSLRSRRYVKPKYHGV